MHYSSEISVSWVVMVGCFIPTWCKRSKHSKQQARGYSEFQLHWNFLCSIWNPGNTQSSLSTLATVLTCWLRVPWDSIQSIESLNATEILLRASCLKLEINGFRCYKAKIEESEKAGSRQESNPRHFWLEPPVLCHWATTARWPPTLTVLTIL